MPGFSDPVWWRLHRALGQSLGLVRAAAPRDLNAVIAMQGVGAVCLVAQMFLLRRVLRFVLAASGHGNITRLLPTLLGLGVVTAVSALSVGLANERTRLMVELVRRHATEQILAVTTSVDLADFETASFNDSLSRARQEALVLPLQVVTSLLTCIQSILAGLALLVTLAAIAPLLLPVLVLGVVPTTLGLRRNSRDLHTVDRALVTTDRQRWYLEDVMSSASGAKETRTFRLPVFLGPRHAELAELRVSAYRSLIHRRSLRIGVISVFSAVVLIAGLALLAWLVVSGRMAAANAATAAVIILQLSTLLRTAAVGAGQVYENSLFLNDVDQFVALAPKPPGTSPTADGVAETAVPLQTLSITNLSFTYPGTDRPVLRDVSLEIAHGEIVALVGENGSGKTTLAKILCGLYPLTSGSIRWNEESITSVDPEAWRRRFAVVFQDFMRYELPARVNIAVGRHEAELDLPGIRAAARLADADDFLAGLPDGYETFLSRAYVGGAELSIGQWQRLALARAFFADAPVLILDEPTSALDPRVEQELLERVHALAGTKVVILVSHRLSSVRFADRIYVLREGVLIEHGRHDELLAAQGHYADLFNLQAAAYRSSPRSSR